MMVVGDGRGATHRHTGRRRPGGRVLSTLAVTMASMLAVLAASARPAAATTVSPGPALLTDDVGLDLLPQNGGVTGEPGHSTLSWSSPLAGALPGFEALSREAARDLPALALLEVATPGLGRSLPSVEGAEPAALTLPPGVSGLAWRSGAKCGDPAFVAWRGRKLDTNNAGTVTHGSWGAMTKGLQDPAFAADMTLSPQPVISFPLLTKQRRQTHAACAAGQYDGYFKEYGALIVAAGGGHAIVRLGWEANVGAVSHAWGIDTAAQIPAYIGCFRRAAKALKSTAPNIKVEWSNAKRGKLPVSVLKSYPGDDVVDLWGLHYYDGDGQFRTQKLWDEGYIATFNGGPQGAGQWLKQAKLRGRKLGFPEWGVWDRTVGPAIADDPVYIQNMFNMFKANARDISYENYYNCTVQHQIFPTTQFPKASALYRALWTKGK